MGTAWKMDSRHRESVVHFCPYTCPHTSIIDSPFLSLSSILAYTRSSSLLIPPDSHIALLFVLILALLLAPFCPFHLLLTAYRSLLDHPHYLLPLILI